MRRRWDQALKLALAAGALNIVVAALVVTTTTVDDLAYAVSMMVLATIAMLTGAYLGARVLTR